MFRKCFIVFLISLAVDIAVSRSASKYVSREEPYKDLFGFDTRDFSCIECKTAVQTAQSMMGNGAPDEEILEWANEACQDLNIASPDVCESMIQLSGYEVLYVLNNTDLNGTTICGFLLGGGHCKTNTLAPWTIDIPGGKPPPSHPEPDPEYSIKIMHISDIHVDLDYVEGSPDECSHPLCCRDWGDEEHPNAQPAGHWGSGASCDVPMRTFEALLDAATSFTPDIIYVSGDLPAHDVWLQNHSSILHNIDLITDRIKSRFPKTPTVMCMGNHESAPVNSFSFPSVYNSGFNMTWLYNHLAYIWSDWIPTESLPRLLEGGFYEYSPFPGLRVISLNMNFCQNQNWWLLLHNEDPVNEVRWLIQTLLNAESAGEKVHIIGHISGGSCEDSWSKVYSQVISRFESTITGQFFGHSHRDSYDIYWSEEDNSVPVSVSFIAGSITGEGQKNPTFKIFTADGYGENATWALLNFESWAMNMTVANQNGATMTPSFYMAYDALSAYQLQSMSPQSWTDATYAMADDDERFDEFLKHYYSWYEYPPQVDTCTPDPNCRTSTLCGLVVTDASNDDPCDRIREIVNSNETYYIY